MRGTRVTLAAVVALALPLGLSAAAAVEEGPPPRPENLSDSDIQSSVHRFSPGTVHRFDLQDSVRVFDLEGSVETLGGLTEEEGEMVISLSTDLLFSANSWELPPGASARIAELVEDIPDGAEIEVTGHTDSRPTYEDFDNQALSERRAEAVAEALDAERPDLRLEVSGRGDSDPAVSEDDDDPQTFAANRRVEIAYGQP